MSPHHNQLTEKARAAFAHFRPIYWLIGGAASGKSTVAAALAARNAVTLIDMDARTYGSFVSRYDRVRHPASSAWLAADNPLAYLLNMPWEQFDRHNQQAQVECLDLLADEALAMAGSQTHNGWLVDGGITHPALLARVIAAENIVCLNASDALRAQAWETDADRLEMRQWIAALPDAAALWHKFLHVDRLMNDTIVRESHAAGIRVIERDVDTPLRPLATAVAAHFGLN